MKEGERKEEDEREREKERETINYYYLPHKERERERKNSFYLSHILFTHTHTQHAHTLPRSQHYFFRNPKNLQKLSSLKICPPLCNRARALEIHNTQSAQQTQTERRRPLRYACRHAVSIDRRRRRRTTRGQSRSSRWHKKK